MNLQFREFNFFSGDAMGFSTGQRQLRKALERQGVNITSEAVVEIQHLSAHLYKRKTKKSYIMPTHEADDIHPSLIQKINEADEVFSVCNHNKQVFENNGVYKKIYVVHQGIDLNVFKYQEKKRDDFLNLLWIGQTSIRKGWDIVIEAFMKAFTNKTDVRLYIKTNGKGKQELINIKDNIIFDSRNLALADMLDLYQNNHVFVYPTRGDATALPVLEAMASGLICLAPSIGGLKDFISEDTAIPLEYKMVNANYGVKTKAPNVLVDDLVDKLQYVYDWYEDIQGHTKEVRKFIKQNYCIDLMAKRLVNIIFNGGLCHG